MNTIDIQRYFAGLDYPAHRDDLIRIAVHEGASDTELQALRALPDRNFNGSIELRDALGTVQLDTLREAI